jgi:hypothetical protein
VGHFGPDTPAQDSLIGRDSMRVKAMLEQVARLPWADMKSVPNLHDMQCWLRADWPDTTRHVEWFPGQPPRPLREAAKVQQAMTRIIAPSRQAY